MVSCTEPSPSVEPVTAQPVRRSAPAATAARESQSSSSVRAAVSTSGSDDVRSSGLAPRSVNDARCTVARAGGCPGRWASVGPIRPPPQVL